MTTEQEEAAAPVSPEVEIDFHGRKIWVRMPSAEQLLVWQRTVKQLGDADKRVDWTASEALTALDRCRRIIDSILVNKADSVWIDDQFLDGELTFKDLMPLITRTVEMFRAAAEEDAPNREARRAAKPAKKAARKKATTR